MTPEPVSDDDIPTLTDVVVPGRLSGSPAADVEAPTDAVAPDFVFDIDFDRMERASVAAEAAPDDDADLPLPWVQAADDAPGESPAPAEPVEIIAAPPLQSPAEEVVTAQADADLDPQPLQGLRERLLARMEQRLHDELALTEARLREQLRAELDTTLAELAGSSSTL
jgi:predicted glycosyltransferase